MNTIDNKITDSEKDKDRESNHNYIELPDFNSLCCYICTEFYHEQKKPLILVCGHTFCENCLMTLFDNFKEIQCSFCKVITKLEKFDDMIINYSMLNLCELISEKNKEKINLNKNRSEVNNTSVLIPNFKSHEKFGFGIYSSNKQETLCSCLKFDNINEIDKLLECQDCEAIACKNCFNNHKNHKLTNIVDFIEMKSESLLNFCKEYKLLSTKMAALHKKMDKSEIEKNVKIEKEKLINFNREIKNLIDKNNEMMIHSMDKLVIDYFNKIDEFKKDIKIFNSDSQRYFNIISELSNFHKIENKERQKLLKVYNFNQFYKEIKNFNQSVSDKLNGLITHETFFKDYLNQLKNKVSHKNKAIKIIKLASEKIMKEMSKDHKINIFKSFKRNWK